MCQCEPVVTTIALCLIGIGRVGAGVGIRFIPDVVSYVIKKINGKTLRRIDNNLTRIQAIDADRVNDGQKYIGIIEERLKYDPIYNKTPLSIGDVDVNLII